jgi:hypothetical protein
MSSQLQKLFKVEKEDHEMGSIWTEAFMSPFKGTHLRMPGKTVGDHVKPWGIQFLGQQYRE